MKEGFRQGENQMICPLRRGSNSACRRLSVIRFCLQNQRPLSIVNCARAMLRIAQRRHSFSRSYGVNLPSSLTTLLPLALGSSPHLPVSVCGTDTSKIHMPFLARPSACFPTLISVPYVPDFHSRESSIRSVSAYLTSLTATEYLPYVHRLRFSASP